MIHEFSSSHLSNGNIIFPTKVIVDVSEGIVTVKKRRLVGYDQTTLKTSKILSVGIRRFNEKLIFSEIVITTAFSELRLNGFMSKDAIALKRLIEGML